MKEQNFSRSPSGRMHRYALTMLAVIAGIVIGRSIRSKDIRSKSDGRANANPQADQLISQSQSREGSNEAPEPAPGIHETRSLFMQRWFAPLSIITVLCSALSFVIWKEGFISPDIEAARGGILIFTDRTDGGRTTEAAVSASMWDIDDETSMLELSLDFNEQSEGTRWYMVVSGQYAPPSSVDRHLFCPGAQTGTRRGDLITCAGPDLSGASSVTYRFGGRIGQMVGDDIHEIIDRTGYDYPETMLVSGLYKKEINGSPMRVMLPVKRPPIASLGANYYRQLAPIGAGDMEFGAGTFIKHGKKNSTPSLYVDVDTGRPLEVLQVSSERFSIREGLGEGKQLAWSNPPASNPGSLEWDSPHGPIGGISYMVFDPFGQNTLSQRGFFAGLLLGLASAAFMLLVEKVLEKAKFSSGASIGRAGTSRSIAGEDSSKSGSS